MATRAALRSRAALALLACAGLAHAQATWPPTPEASQRLTELRAVLGDPQSTPAAREAARAEMMRMILANPDVAPKKMPPRAAVAVPVEPLVKKPEVAKVVPSPPVSRVAPPVAASPPVTPPGGGTLVPQGSGYVDPATGRLYQSVPGGLIDPATGRFVPKP